MRSDSLVLRNSLWIGLQPLILNIVSIFVIGYIARVLGQEDYGKFVFAFAFVALLMPFCNLGLRAVTVRDLAANREEGPTLLGKVSSLRFVLSLIAFLILVVLVNILDYQPSTRTVVYIAGLTLFTQTAATTLFDAFQGYERMQFIAYANLISGTVLTAFSIIVLVLGYGLVALTIVYVAGNALLFLLAFVFYRRHMPAFIPNIDCRFWWQSIKTGIPFFVVGALSILNLRVGVVLLSKMSGDAAVGQYGAALNLIQRLSVISESLCTAIFPTMAVLFAGAKMAELNDLTKKYFHYLVVLSLPIAIGTTLLSMNIIDLIYGDTYANSAIVLSVLAWNLPFFFGASLFGYCLGAIRQQPRVVRVALVAAVVNLVGNIVLIPHLQAVGVALAYLVSSIVSVVATFALVRRFTGFGLSVTMMLKVFVAAGMVALTVLLLRDVHWIAAIIASVIVYFLALVLLKIMKRDDWRLLREAVTRKRVPEAEDSDDRERVEVDGETLDT